MILFEMIRIPVFVLLMTCISPIVSPANAQNLDVTVTIDDPNDGFNIYCTSNMQCCAVAKGPSGNYMIPFLDRRVDWNTAWYNMNYFGYGNYGGCKADAVAVWNIYCTGDRKSCVVAKGPSGIHMFPLLNGPVDWNTAWYNMRVLGYYTGSNPTAANNAVWNIYCTTCKSQCKVAAGPYGEFTVPLLNRMVDWNTAWYNMKVYGYAK